MRRLSSSTSSLLVATEVEVKAQNLPVDAPDWEHAYWQRKLGEGAA